MMLKLKIRVLLVLMFISFGALSQIRFYPYKRELTGVNAVWHRIELPDNLYKHSNNGFADLRIFGIKGKDTIEVPFLLNQLADKIVNQQEQFKQLNQSSNADGYFYTFQVPEPRTINQINLTFKPENFSWMAALEGSNDNKTWFSILKNYRILSIRNKDTDYRFTRLSFPDSRYQYFRLAIKSDVDPALQEAKIYKTDTIPGSYTNVPYNNIQLHNDVKEKQTQITVSLKNPSPVSLLKIPVKSRFDFYRTFKIEYATDSFKTERGVQYNFVQLYNGTLSSMEKPAFNFPNTIAAKLRLTIQNHDNPPLTIDGLSVKGNAYEIIARFDDSKLNYALYYGDKKAIAPDYEIAHFEEKIPENLTTISIGSEERNPAYTVKAEEPLFKNKIWLWVLMSVIIFLLGWFSFKMLKN